MTDAEPEGAAAERERVVAEHARARGGIEEFAGGEIRSYRGIVNRWLLAVYLALGAWACYYLVRFWGGLGPGLAR
jgi:hypothetical protein